LLVLADLAISVTEPADCREGAERLSRPFGCRLHKPRNDFERWRHGEHEEIRGPHEILRTSNGRDTQTG
jgi:hypothetical protein